MIHTTVKQPNTVPLGGKQNCTVWGGGGILYYKNGGKNAWHGIREHGGFRITECGDSIKIPICIKINYELVSIF